MIYIIDGPDGAGKSTLAQQIHLASPGSEILHFGAPQTKEEANNYWQVYLNALNKATDHTLIFDRSWYSDMVYGPIMRGRQELTDPHRQCLEHAVRSLGGGLVIYCTGVQRKLWSRCLQRGETYIKNGDQHKAICQMYDAVMHSIKRLPLVVFNTTATW